ncbi:MAG TPA: toll/interleukin-1 receptor domain-containing protein [Pyrinomonadaceae bacterium]|nr:toll/interleukin-1 receptor domain-containing protein [Pyrinomonadaceae bacterium]
MANTSHVELIKKGSVIWNAWRDANPDVMPDLSGADLLYLELARADLSKANLGSVDFSYANLIGSNFSNSNVSGAVFVGANLDGADFTGADGSDADFSKANLTRAYLNSGRFGNAYLADAFLNQANLTDADLNGAVLRGARLDGANLSEADLTEADLRRSNLSGANLSEAFLYGANLNEVDLTEADFTQARIGATTFGDTNLSTAKGLDTVEHFSPSTIGIDTLFKSDGKIPDAFLRGAGVPEDFITFVPSLVGRAIEFYSCFISYSHQDEGFSRRLHSRMRSENLRVWYAPEDLKGGRKLHEEIFRAIQVHDKLLLVLSEDSMKSEWVITEIRRAGRVEREENRRKLFPIRLVDFEAIQKWECFDADSHKDLAAELREYYIPDFSTWKDHDAFEREFAKLLSALKAEQVEG